MSYSVIIPTVNEDLFIRCAEGIESKYSIEVIVRNVKNRSEKIAQICKEKGWKYSYCDDESLAASINWGFRVAQNNYLMHMQDDVILTEGQMDFLFEKYKDNEGNIAVLAPEYTLNDNIDKRHEIITHDKRHDWFMFIISRKAFEQTGTFDTYFYPYYYEDGDFHRRMLQKGLRAGILTTLIVNHLKSQTINRDTIVNFAEINDRYFNYRWPQ